MADDVDVTPGTGKTIRTDDVGGKQYQVVKHDLGGDGVSVPLEAEALHGVSGLSLNDATTTGAGTAIGSGNTILTEHAMRVTHVNAATLVVALQGLFDDWATIGEWKLAERVSGSVLVVRVPCKQVRANITTISGGSAAVDAHIVSK